MGGLYDQASSGSPQFLLLAGETGVGKSMLIAEFVRAARLNGSLVIEGRAPPITGPVTPFAAITALLRSLADADPGPHASRAGTASGLTQLFLKPSERASPEGGAQILLFERLLRLLQRASEESTVPAVLIIEDLQWSDESSRQFISYLVANARSFPLFGIFTHRIGDPAGSTFLAPLMDELARTAQVEYLELLPFSGEDVAIQVGLLTHGAATPEAIGQIAKLSGGNPSVVEELVQTRNPDPSASLRRLMLGRIAGLSDETQLFLRLAAVVGHMVPAALLDAAARSMKLDSGACARIARDARIIDVVEDQQSNVYAFRQPILQETLYADLLPGDRATMHGVVAKVLSGDPDLHADPLLRIELARHAVIAGHPDAPTALVSAAEAAEEMYAFRAAHEFYEQAISARASTGLQSQHRDIGFRLERLSSPQPSDRELRIRSGQAASLAGDPHAAIERLRSVIATDRDPDHRLISRLAQYSWEAGNRTEAVALYREVVDQLSDADLSASDQAEILRSGARTMQLAGDHRAAADWAARAVAIAHDSGLASAERRARSTLGAALALLGDVQGSLLASESTITDRPAASSTSMVRPRPSRITDLLADYWTQSIVLDQAGRTSASADVAIEGWRKADRLGAGDSWGARLGALAARRLIDLGRWAPAAEIIDSMLGQATIGGPPVGEILLLKARLQMRQGFLHEADTYISRARGSTGDQTLLAEAMLFANVSAEQQIWRQQFTDASSIAEKALIEDSASDDRHTRMELAGIAVQAAADGAASARMRRSPSDCTASESTATELCGQLRGMVQAEAAPAPRQRALVATAEAELMRARGSSDATLWKSVAEMWTALEMPFQLVYANWRRAEVLVTEAKRSPTHTTELQAVHQSATRLGTHIILAHLESLARRARISLARREPSMQRTIGRASRGPSHGLTARELEVLALVADGRTNRQIGESLFITENTAGGHVSNILTKLNARNRMEAASIAVGLDLIHGASASDLLPPPQLETGTRGRLALMFTDMARSTALIEAIGDDSWSDLANWHDATLRAQFASHRGQEVDHAGDGFFVVFVHVAAAIRCGVAIQQALADHRRSHGFAPTVKIGIHVDDVTRSGARYQGKGVHLAARIGSAASPGEILVSSESLQGLVMPYVSGDTRLISARGLREPVSVRTILW